MSDSALLPLLVSKKIKFDVLDSILPDYSENTNVINIFLNTRTFYSKLYTEQFSEMINVLKDGNKKVFCSELINTIGHYRLYFWSRYKLYTNFFIYHTNQVCNRNKEIYPDYMKEFYENHKENGKYSYISDLVESNLELFKALTKKMPFVYYMNCEDKIDLNILPLVVLKVKPNFAKFPSLLLSNNLESALHLTTNYRFNILTLQSDKSRLVDISNVFEFLTNDSNFSERSLKVSALNILDILAMSGVKKISLPGFSKVGPLTAIKFIYKIVSETDIISDNEYVPSNLIKLNIKNEDNLDIYKRNRNILGLRENFVNLSEKDKLFIKDQIQITNPEWGQIAEANQRYFKQTPIKDKYLFLGNEENDDEY
jgi:hypothetical protein